MSERYRRGLFPKDEWIALRTIWPDKDGWGVFNPKSTMLLESGLPSKEHAQSICDEMNARVTPHDGGA